MSENLSCECQRCRKKIGPNICHVSIVATENMEGHSEYSHGAWWLCGDCWRDFDAFMDAHGKLGREE